MRLAEIGGLIPRHGVRAVRVARGQVSCEGQGDRRDAPAGLRETGALQPGHDAADGDGDDRQQQGFQLLQGHGRPPAIKKGSGVDPRWRVRLSVTDSDGGYIPLRSEKRDTLAVDGEADSPRLSPDRMGSPLPQPGPGKEYIV